MIIPHPKGTYIEMINLCGELAVQSNSFEWTDLANNFQNLASYFQTKADRYKGHLGFLKSIAQGLAYEFIGSIAYDRDEIEGSKKRLYESWTDFIYRLKDCIDKNEEKFMKQGHSKWDVVGMKIILTGTMLNLLKLGYKCPDIKIKKII
jgi:hypothetical protein